MTELPTIAKAAKQMQEGELRPVELVESCLTRIDQLDERLQAWVHVDANGAYREAERLGKLLDDGESLGPLHGVPVGVKDLIDVAGWPTKCGSVLREGHVAQRDAAVVTSLRKAGAIILGKTVTTEWASFDPAPTRNPWNLEHTPGGSSSGSAAAVAAEMCLAALGTQTGGSIIRPAAFCGVCGLKPGFGEVAMDGIAPLTLYLDHVGPIARRVSDLYLIWQALIAGTHGSLESHYSKRWADTDLETWIGAYGLNKTLFVLDGPLLERMQPAMREVYQCALARLQSSLHTRELPLPESFRDIHRWHRTIMAAEAAAYHRELFPRERARYGREIGKLLDEGLALSAVDHAEALIRREEMRGELARLLHQHEDLLGCLVMPATLGPAPGMETTGDPAFNSPWSYVGWPSLTIPCGLAADGLPCGLQFIAATPPQVFAMAGLCERILQFHERPAILEDAS
ncbi:MAG TPA: amidase [Pirellulaceae bacterium]|nr:amidase [Pirellulaceae bacterium]